MGSAAIIWAILIAMGVPTSVTALGLCVIQRSITKNEKSGKNTKRKKNDVKSCSSSR